MRNISISLFGIGTKPTQPNKNFKPGRLDVRVKCNNDIRVLANVFLFFPQKT